jgi:hypothetical protein
MKTCEFSGSVRRKQEGMDVWCCYSSVNSRNLSIFCHRNIKGTWQAYVQYPYNKTK